MTPLLEFRMVFTSVIGAAERLAKSPTGTRISSGNNLGTRRIKNRRRLRSQVRRGTSEPRLTPGGLPLRRGGGR